MALFGVMDEGDLDVVYTYEADSLSEAAALYLDDPDAVGVVVRVFALGRHAPAFVKSSTGSILLVSDAVPVTKE